MAQSCGFCGSAISNTESSSITHGGAATLLACPQCGNWSGATVSNTRSVDMAHYPFSERRRLAVASIGAVLLMISAYCPLLLPNSWEKHEVWNLFWLQPMAGFAIVAVALVSIVMAVWGFYRFLWISIGIGLITIVMSIVSYRYLFRDTFPAWGCLVAFLGLLLMSLTTRDRLPDLA